MQYTNSKNLLAAQPENKHANALHVQVEGIIEQLDNNTQLSGEAFDAEELLPKNISRNKRALIERMVALQLLNTKSKPNATQQKSECAY